MQGFIASAALENHKSYGQEFEFDAEIKKVPDIDGAYVEIPFDVRAAMPYHRATQRHTDKIGKQAGDMVRVTLEER